MKGLVAASKVKNFLCIICIILKMRLIKKQITSNKFYYKTSIFFFKKKKEERFCLFL